MANPPTDSTHLSDFVTADMIDQYGGTVDSQFAKKSIMRKFVPVRPIRGTDTLLNRRVGKTTLQAITPGVRPEVSATLFGKASVTVDTLILARDNRSQLNEFQTDFNARQEIGEDHGKEIAKFFDEVFLIMGAHGAQESAPGSLGGAFGAGQTTTLTAANDELDSDKLYTAIEGIIVAMQLDDMDTDECAIFVNPTQHAVLLNNDKLVDTDFSMANGNFADGKFKTLMGVPVLWTNRLPDGAAITHKLSNAANSNAYDMTAAEARISALVLHPKALLAGETIPLQSDVFFDKVERSWFIDSFLAFGVANRLPGACGSVVYAV
jgi:hypothetical protein